MNYKKKIITHFLCLACALGLVFMFNMSAWGAFVMGGLFGVLARLITEG